MQRAGRVLKSFGVKSYKLLLIIHFLTQDALNLGFLLFGWVLVFGGFFLSNLNLGIIFPPCGEIKVPENSSLH